MQASVIFQVDFDRMSSKRLAVFVAGVHVGYVLPREFETVHGQRYVEWRLRSSNEQSPRLVWKDIREDAQLELDDYSFGCICKYGVAPAINIFLRNYQEAPQTDRTALKMKWVKEAETDRLLAEKGVFA